MTPAEALELARRAGATGRFVVSEHAWIRMRQRGANLRDVRLALINAMHCTPAEAGRWRMVGPDADGDELTVIVAFDGLTVVVTIF